MDSRPVACTLAVGTEVTDGQIIDRNSAWISARLVAVGIEVREHRAVPDDRSLIEVALRELATKCDLIFVTGGLGPTSDDFTREVIAEVFSRPLEFDEGSWQHVHAQLGSRGIAVREIQKQQCFFPAGCRVFTNPAGTANAFAFDQRAMGKSRSLKLYALPGPPSEIAAVWTAHLDSELGTMVPKEKRERLRILRCLGRGESQVAEVVEDLIRGAPIRVGYRAHVPYVEVKIWYREAEFHQISETIIALERALESWIVNRDSEDAVDPVIEALRKGHELQIIDEATGGIFSERVAARVRENASEDFHPALTIVTRWPGQSSSASANGKNTVGVLLEADKERNLWHLRVKSGDAAETVLEEKPPYNYKVLSERGRRYITEKALVLLAKVLTAP